MSDKMINSHRSKLKERALALCLALIWLIGIIIEKGLISSPAGLHVVVAMAVIFVVAVGWIALDPLKNSVPKT
jgi:hypothetical protein